MQIRYFSQPVVFAALALAAVLCAAPQCRAQFSGNQASSDSAFSIPQSQLIQADALNRMVMAGGVQRPVVLQVGSHVMFSQAHVPGAIYAGPGSQASGLLSLRNTVLSMPRNKFIVLYCGCCPWSHCPNVGPAYKTLHDLGFTNVKVLYLANNFGDDWVYKGYRIERGQ